MRSGPPSTYLNVVTVSFLASDNGDDYITIAPTALCIVVLFPDCLIPIFLFVLFTSHVEWKGPKRKFTSINGTKTNCQIADKRLSTTKGTINPPVWVDPGESSKLLSIYVKANVCCQGCFWFAVTGKVYHLFLYSCYSEISKYSFGIFCPFGVLNCTISCQLHIVVSTCFNSPLLHVN